MKKEMIKKLVYEFWERDLRDVKPRDVNLRLIESDLVNDIVGIRRSGKTYFMFFLIKLLEKKLRRQQFIYLNCEDRRVYPLHLEELNTLISLIYQEDLLKNKVFLLLDEVQKIRGWEVFVKSVYDEFKSKIKVLVSGSVKSLLSRDYGNLLSGRHKSIQIFPLSFQELLSFKGFSPKRLIEEREAKLLKYTEEYLKGSFPRYVLTGENFWIEQVYEDIIERDIKTRKEVKKKIIIDEMSMLLLPRVASQISFNKLKNLLRNKGYRISTDLIIRYFNLFEEVFLFNALPIYSEKYSEVMKNPKKIYVIDNSFIYTYPLKLTEERGRLMENLVFTEFLKKGLKNGKNLFYWRDYGGREIDFVLKEGLRIKQLIQVTYASAIDEVDKRELRSLVKASELLKCRNLLVITWDLDDKVQYKGSSINLIPLWKWLLTNTYERNHDT